MDNLIKNNKIVLSFFFFFFLIAKGLDRTVLTGSCCPTPVLELHRINKKSGSLCLKNWFSSRSRFSQFDLPVQSGSENLEYDQYFSYHCQNQYVGTLHIVLVKIPNGINND